MRPKIRLLKLKRRYRPITKLAIAVFLPLTITACAVGASGKPEEYGAQIDIVNHTDRYIYSTSVGNSGGGNATTYTAGVANVCCVTLPEVWRPGIEFLVQWDMPVNGNHIYKEETAIVEEYSEPGSLYLHIFPGDKVRIVVSKWFGGSDKHPIMAPDKKAILRGRQGDI